ncbi:hypothetical protein GLOTRDRAFT_136275 [Gloeophyllum trabeum ATCC 11539]|uniref:Sucraseferredoxin-like protein n=1 Tax=Gloeophyllum trabeum (strain ATCC 11539 / FP-39264 / Madison 617) TaxID=670483 RepID=S7RWX5_GLOTA|nr:uncharacterized protein GLOTRDRAFT_136275 [Gloeophyllum trabeum ATCC 11539]EPQ59395.1 hypothetical protein GLOTRDRAFT_136275 [Gloeophyllum trabeum ATCC 11539]
MSGFRKFKSIILGQSPDTDANRPAFDAANIPLATADCRSCADPCDKGACLLVLRHDEYPKRFDVDRESQMLGSVKPFRRQIVISTGKTDWEREVTDAEGTLAAYVYHVKESSPSAKRRKAGGTNIPGVYDVSEGSNVLVLNGSHKTVSDDENLETVLILPDYKVATDIPRSLGGAKALWKAALDPSVGRAGAPLTQGKTWILPYNCVILLCSHKRRDNRCAISAPKLEHTFTQALEREGWEAHTQLEDPSLGGPPLDDLQGSEEEKEAQIVQRLKELGDAHTKRALILKNSHIGGHKFAGNCIIYTPQGSSVWYGRVTPHEVDSIVKNTIIGGQILLPLLRGGLNLARPGRHSLNDW